MEVVANNTLLPGDPRLIEHIVCELKSQGIFDQFRKECISDVDTKPAYQNLRQRVEGSVTGFLKTQAWKADMNKNQLREMLRKNIYESGFLEMGVERIVDQVVYPKINSVFLPQVEDVVYKFLGLEKPARITSFMNGPLTINTIDLLPTDLDPISPDSEVMEKSLNKSDKTNDDLDKLDDSKNDEFESPPFEPITEQSVFSAHEESSNDSHVSGISGLTSHDSNMSSHDSKLNIFALDVANQDSQLSKVSSNSRLSIITTDSKQASEKMDISDDTQTSKCSRMDDPLNWKDANVHTEDFAQTSENGLSQFQLKQEITDEIDAIRMEISEHQNGRPAKSEEPEGTDRVEIKMEIDEDSQMSTHSQIASGGEQTKPEKEEIKEEEDVRTEAELKVDPDISRDAIKLELEKELAEDTKKLIEDGIKEEDRDSKVPKAPKTQDSLDADSNLESKKEEPVELKQQDSLDDASKLDAKKSDSKSSERTRHDSEKKHSSRYSESKDKRDDKDRRSDKEKRDKDRHSSSSGSKDKYRDKSKDSKSKEPSRTKDDKSSKSKEDRDKDSSRAAKDEKSRSSSSSKHSRDRSSSKSDSKSSKDRSESRSRSSKDSKSKDEKPKSDSSKSDDAKKCESAKKSEDSRKESDSKRSTSKSEDGKASSKPDEVKSSSISSRTREHSRSDSSKHASSSSRDRKTSSSKDSKDRKDAKKPSKRDKDDHSSSRDKKSDSRRSADRDSNDGSSGIGNNSNSNSSKEKESSVSSSKSKSSDNSTDSSQGSNSGDSGQSDNSQPCQTPNRPEDTASLKGQVKILTGSLGGKGEITISPAKLTDSDSDTALQQVKIKKPKIASNIYEARRLMKVRKKLEKMERKRQRKVQLAQEKKDKERDSLSLDDTDSVDSESLQIVEQEDSEVENTVGGQTSAPETSVVSKESWDALEAKLSLNVDYDSYIDENCDSSSSSKHNNSRTRRSSDEEDCLYFTSQMSPATARYLKKVASLQRDGARLAIVLEDCRKMAPPHTKSEVPAKRPRKTNQKYYVDELDLKLANVNKKPAYEVKNDTVSKQKIKGKKRKVDAEMDGLYSENNNRKINNHFDVTDLHEDFEETMEASPSASNTSNGSLELTTKIKPPARSKKSKKSNHSVHSSDVFPLPLSPESDVSASSVEVKGAPHDKEPPAPVRTPRAPPQKTQRYSSDDLYKPRPFVSGSSRRQRGLLNNTDKMADSTAAKLQR